MIRRLAAVPAAALIALSLTACGGDAYAEPEATGVCVNPDTGERVDDDRCGGYDHDSGVSDAFMWYFIASSLNQPAIGTQVVHNTYYSTPKTNPYAGFKKPTTVIVNKGVPRTGWKPTAGSSTSFQSKVRSTPPAYKPAGVNAKPPSVKNTILNQRQAPPKPVYNKPIKVGR